MILKALDKIRRAPYAVRQRFVMMVTIISVACITLIWFIFFTLSLPRWATNNSNGTPAPTNQNTASHTP